MAYLGNQPSNNFVSLKRQVITGNGGSSYTLDHKVASVNDVAIFVNNVRQNPSTYSISTTTLTLGGSISSSDSCYVIFLGQALQTVVPDTNTITTAMMQDSAITTAKINDDAVTSAKVSGLGNYVVEKIDKYTYGTEVNIANTASTYSDIAGGNTINFTPTSTNDIIFLIGQNTLQYSATNGAGLGFTQGTSSTLSSSDTKIAVTGQHSEYNTASALYSISNIQATVTGLSASTTYYFDMHGVVYYGGGTQFTKFNKVSIPSGTGADAMHSVIGIHYKYIG